MEDVIEGDNSKEQGQQQFEGETPFEKGSAFFLSRKGGRRRRCCPMLPHTLMVAQAERLQQRVMERSCSPPCGAPSR
eukprot:5243126-Amphidinium_carterae.1